MIINCAIVDDDQFIVEDIKQILTEINVKHSQSFQLKIVAEYSDPIAAINELNQSHIHLLFIDFEMPVFNGIEVVKRLDDKNIQVIFISSYKEKSIEIINNTSISGFITKPPQLEELVRLLQDKVIPNLKSTSNAINIINSNKTTAYHFKPEEVFYIESDGKYKKIWGIDSKQEIAHIEASFNDINLEKYNFLKINKRVFINKMHIRKTSKNKIELTNAVKFEIGTSKSTKEKFWYYFNSLFNK